MKSSDRKQKDFSKTLFPKEQSYRKRTSNAPNFFKGRMEAIVDLRNSALRVRNIFRKTFLYKYVVT